LIRYDEGSNLYTRELLTDFTKPLRVTLKMDNEDKTFEFKVKNLVRQEKIGDIFEFINGKTGIRPRDPIRIIETLFKQNIRNDLVCIKNKFYSRRQQLVDLGEFLLINMLVYLINYFQVMVEGWQVDFIKRCVLHAVVQR
jgi:uncharacterized protein YkvS